MDIHTFPWCMTGVAMSLTDSNAMRVQHAAELARFVTLSVQFCQTQFLDCMIDDRGIMSREIMSGDARLFVATFFCTF